MSEPEKQQQPEGTGSSEQQQKQKKERKPRELTEEQRLKKEEAERKALEKKQKKEATASTSKQQRGVKESLPIVKVTVEEVKAGSKLYGEFPLIQSTEKIGAKKSITGFDFVDIQELNKSLVGKTVALRTRVFTVRGSGNAAFLLLRQGFFTAQATLFAGGDIPKDLVKYAAKLSKETVIEIVADVNAAPEPIKSASQQDVELAIKRLYVVSAAQALPFLVEDAMKSDAVLEAQEAASAESGSATTTTAEPKAVSRDVRLDNRIIDLRAPAHIAIFKIQSAVGMLFREFLYTKGFMEIHSPKLIGTASEGGADVFQVKYFGGHAYLAQSPQLYKQMSVEADFMRVFEIAPVFRAENSHTHRHLTEFMGLDLEMEIKHHYSEVLDVLDELFVYIFEGLQKRFAKELEVINEQYPFKPISFTKNNLRLTYPEAIKLLREDGEEIGDLDDLSTPQEKRLGRVVKEKYGTDFYMLERFPLKARPFYTMPCPDNEDYSNSYDLFLRGEEIASGAQRVHDPELLVANAAKKGVNLTPIQAYVDSFKYGAWPHGGAGIGLERVVMLYLGIGNVRKVSLFPRDPKRLSP